MSFFKIKLGILMLLSLSANAELTEMDLYAAGDGLITKDGNGFEWLDLTETAGMSYLQVKAELGAGGIYKGWNFATAKLVAGLFDSAGAQGTYDFPDVNRGWSKANDGIARDLLSLWGMLDPAYEKAYFIIADPIHIEDAKRIGVVQGISLTNTNVSEDLFSLNSSAAYVTSESPLLASALYRAASIPKSLDDSNRLFDWAENYYPQIFSPPNSSTFEISGYLARHYTETNTYIGTRDNYVYVYGDVFEGLLLVGKISQWLPLTTGKGRLNDTGITTCATENISESYCPQISYPGQDAQYGRDVTHNDDSNGHAGFNFTKLNNRGNALPAIAPDWTCVRDNVTGLIWEVKTDDGGLSDKDWIYSWYNSTGINNGGDEGVANGIGRCYENINCDTEKFVHQVNSQGLCGANDWRMPTKKELENILIFGRNNPKIDGYYFPNTNPSDYWSATPHAHQGVWYVNFSNGRSIEALRYQNRRVRLVRME